MRIVSTGCQALTFAIAVVAFAFAENGQSVTHILSHDRTLVITDPSTGSNPFRAWAVFPSKTMQYRKAVLHVTYQCPDSLHCGEWDYIDNIFLRRVGGETASSKDIEIARMISPYGWRFGSTWHFTWHVDITDFAFLLHDSVEVEFLHTGYESNKDRGWLITLDFALTEGRPAMTCLGMDTLWHGSIPYGDSSRPIDSALPPISFTNTVNADIARLRILQTGHGMDDQENCAEFCNKYRRILFDDSLINERQIWRACGDNPLYPQAGTWIFNRANWCPGSIVLPDQHDLPIAPGSTHTVDMEMEPYINPKNPTANYYIYSYLFFYSAPWASHDVSLEEIINPSTADEYSRLNPVCSGPRLLIKNCGKEPLTSVTITYGSPDSLLSFIWTGDLPLQQTTAISLPGTIRSGQQFTASLESPNGEPDEYPGDNTLSSDVTATPVYGTELVLAFLSNKDSSHNSYQLVDENGQVVRERALGTLGAGIAYRDTFRLQPGCYQLVVIDTAGDGLDFWFNPDGGYGYVRLLDMRGQLLRSFLSDFGSEIRHSFTVAEGVTLQAQSDELPLVNPFPIRNRGIFTIDFFDNEPHDIAITVMTEDSTSTVFQANLPNVREAMIPVDISAEPDGFYWVKVTSGERTATRKIKVKHKD